jgi:hypothetical protein
VLVDDVSCDYKRTGEMEREGIVWFPPLWKQALNFIKTGFLVDHKAYQRTCQFYWGDITFQEVYHLHPTMYPPALTKQICVLCSMSWF